MTGDIAVYAPGNRRKWPFDISPEEGPLLEEVCHAFLKRKGVEAKGFFERLRAGESLGAALGIPPEILEVVYARAHRWFSVGKPDRAEPLFRALCIADGRVADYWVGLGVCLRMRKDWDSASLAFTVASSLRPDWAVPVFHACELALASGDIPAAGRQMKRLEALLSAERAQVALPEAMLAETRRMARALRLRAGHAEAGS